MTNQETIDKMEQIKLTLVAEYDDFCRDDVQFSYDAEGNIDNEDDRLWQEERVERDESMTQAIANVEQIIQMLTNKPKPETVFK